jgi:hypothetical protein
MTIKSHGVEKTIKSPESPTTIGKGVRDIRSRGANVRFGTFALQKGMSALPSKADMCAAIRDARFGPIADLAVL